MPMIVLLVIWVVLVFYVISLYNGLVTLKHNIDNATADIDVQMKQRFDLVENLVNTVKWYATHEKWTLESVTELRTKFLSSSNMEDKMEANNMLSQSLKSLFAVSESYPDLKANTNFLSLQTELSDLENKIAASRRFLNSAIKEYNIATETFPSNMFAWMFGFSKDKEYFEITNEAEKAVPKVQF